MAASGGRARRLIGAANPVGIDRDDQAARDDIGMLNVLTLPLGRPVIVHLSSRDVIHSFTLNEMRVRQDVTPGIATRTWFTPIVAGRWDIACSQLCGLGHYRMRGEYACCLRPSGTSGLRPRSSYSAVDSVRARVALQVHSIAAMANASSAINETLQPANASRWLLSLRVRLVLLIAMTVTATAAATWIALRTAADAPDSVTGAAMALLLVIALIAAVDLIAVSLSYRPTQSMRDDLLKQRNEQLVESYHRLFALREQLASAEQLASVGQTAANVAHQVGTPLNLISGYVQLLKEEARARLAARCRGSPSSRSRSRKVTTTVRTLLDRSRQMGRKTPDDGRRRCVEPRRRSHAAQPRRRAHHARDRRAGRRHADPGGRRPTWSSRCST